MGAWVKLFSDGTQEIGTDDDVNSGIASWSKGRLTDIREVQLTNIVTLASLSVPDTNWYQFDRYTFDIIENHAKRIFRVIQAEIQNKHVGMWFNQSWAGKYMFWASVNGNDPTAELSMCIPPDLIGSWATIVLHEFAPPFAIFTKRGSYR